MITPTIPATPLQVGRHYDELDAFYRELWGEHVHHGLWHTGRESTEQAVQQLVDYVARQAALQPGDRVCDVGCGYGTTARYLAHTYGADVTGLTVSETQHAYAGAQPPPASGRATYRLQDWLANDLPDHAFDVVLAIESTAHMADKARFFTEAFRVLRPGGRLVVCAWLARDDPQPWEVRYLLEPICREGCLPSLGTASEYRTWLADAGLALDAFEDLSSSVQRTWSLAIGRLVRGLLTRPRYMHYLLDAANTNRSFVWSPLRLWLGYRTGAFRYGCFVAHRPA